MYYVQSLQPETDTWVKIDPRQQVIHLIPAGWKKTVCGIPYTYGTYLPIGKARKCQQCKPYQQHAKLTNDRQA